MSRIIILSVSLVLALGSCKGEDFYSYKVQDHLGNDVSLEKYRGKVTLVVNVASRCGYTEGTYQALKKLHDILSFGDYFSVLAFPCNQFGDQEPLNMPEIIEFVTNEFDVEFPVFNKIKVIGEHADPAFKRLTEESSVVPDWNFYKYLVDETGHVVAAWGTRTTIEDIIQAAVEKAKAATKSSSNQTEKSVTTDSEAVKDEL
ncbi:glutathione peroxidase 7-like [Homarus americanus]|uniref:Glutathione peroxidase 8-like n=1 Tax=Homarus americanus TaxID=6706 RepID=A0A8J5MSI7_HOMAM|nr:glutathione peroxidase 7-like [Homarus americanus]KAG7161781.1 glutathione peroxidase 8-like [Homarus americanus]